MSQAKYSQGAVDVTWAVLLAARDGAIPLNHELSTPARGLLARGTQTGPTGSAQETDRK